MSDPRSNERSSNKDDAWSDTASTAFSERSDTTTLVNQSVPGSPRLDMEDSPLWTPERGTTPENYANAIRQYSDQPGNAGWHIESSRVEVLPNGREVPLGELVEALNIGLNVEETALAPVVRDAFDYHGMPLTRVEMAAGSLPRVYGSFDQSARPSGWENEFVASLDGEFARNPGFYPERPLIYSNTRDPRASDTPTARQLENLARHGMTASNWARLPQVQQALQRHGIPTRHDPGTGRIHVDRDAYSAAQRSGTAAAASTASTQARTGDRRPRDDGSGPSASTADLQRRRRRARR